MKVVIDDYRIEKMDSYTEPLEAKIKRQAAEITRLLSENEELKKDLEYYHTVTDTCDSESARAAWQEEALEKRIPIRPIMRIEERGFNKGCIYPHCPICDTMPVPHPNVSYCDKCGQAIDWSELE